MKRLMITERKRESLYEVALGVATIYGVKYSINLLRSLRVKGDRFIVTSIRADDKEVWRFKDAKYNGICVVTEVGDKVALCFLSHGNLLEWVVPLEHLRDLQIIDGELISRMDVKEVILLKKLTAREIGSVARLSPSEEKVSHYLSVKQREKEEAIREERRRLKEEKREEIMTREQISVFTETGAGRFGRPVVEDEWHCLANGTRVILVESFNKETKEPGPAIEAFIVKKGKGGRIEKENASKVQSERSLLKVAPVKASRVIIFDVDGHIKQVPVYKTTRDILQAQKEGLNGGSIVTAEDQKDERGRYSLSLVSGPTVKKMGVFAPI